MGVGLKWARSVTVRIITKHFRDGIGQARVSAVLDQHGDAAHPYVPRPWRMLFAHWYLLIARGAGPIASPCLFLRVATGSASFDDDSSAGRVGGWPRSWRGLRRWRNGLRAIPGRVDLPLQS